VYKSTGNTSILMEKTANGLGVLTEVSYAKLSEPSSQVYQRGAGATFPVFDFQGPLTVVSSVQSDNGMGTMNTRNYLYEGAKIHIQGKGFLGYSKRRTIDVTADIESETLSNYNATYFYPQVLQTLTKRVGTTDTIIKVKNTWSQRVLDSVRKRIFPYVSSTVQTNKLTNQSVTISNVYDNYGNPTSLIKSYDNGVSETISNDYDNIISTTQWLLGRATSTQIQYEDSSITVTKAGIRSFAQNSNLLESVTWYPGTDKQINSAFNYNSNGTLQSATATASGMSRSKSYTYESDDIRIHSSTDPYSHTITNSYDQYGRLSSQKDFLDNISTFQYDPLGRSTLVTSGDGSQVTTVFSWHDPTENPVSALYSVEKVGNDGSQKINWYDKLGRSLRSDLKGFDGTMIYTTTVYNVKGQIETVSDPYYSNGTALLNTFTYDSYGRKTELSKPSGRNTTWSYSNNIVTETTAGKSFLKTFSTDGTLASATDNGGTIEYTYFPDKKVKSISAPGGIITSMQYDIAGNQTQIIDPSAGTITYAYNAFGELTDQQNAKAQTTHLVYYNDGRLDHKTQSEEGTTTYSYNDNKQLIRIASPGGIFRSFEQDSIGRIKSIIQMAI
jgi:YD repeat-containing protein